MEAREEAVWEPTELLCKVHLKEGLNMEEEQASATEAMDVQAQAAWVKEGTA